MNKGLERILRAAAAVAVLVVILVLVLNWWGDYRGSDSSDVQEDTGASIEATETPEGEDSGGGEGSATEEESTDESTDEPSLGTVVVLVNGLNFRAEPSGSAELLDGFADGVELDYLATENGWFKVRDSKGRVGYVSAQEQFARLDQ